MGRFEAGPRNEDLQETAESTRRLIFDDFPMSGRVDNPVQAEPKAEEKRPPEAKPSEQVQRTNPRTEDRSMTTKACHC